MSHLPSASLVNREDGLLPLIHKTLKTKDMIAKTILQHMVDGLMVSLGVNEYAMSAVNLAIPFTNALFSIAALFAVGSSTLCFVKLARDT